MPDFTRLTAASFPEYLVQAGLCDRKDLVTVKTLPGGVSNTVLLAEWTEGHRFVAKQSLGKLKVVEDWFSDRGRIFREADSIIALQPLLGEQFLPKVVHIDRANYMYIMKAAPADSVSWKELLLQGECRASVACSVGLLLARMIRHSRTVDSLKAAFADRSIFEQLRIDAYYRQAAARNPDVSQEIEELISDTAQIQTALVHGDYSPKNILISASHVFLIDFEVVHWGDPSFDVAFLLNHLFLKCFYRPSLSRQYLALASKFLKALAAEIPSSEVASMEKTTARHLGGLLLARVDGKSPVEYLTDAATKENVRNLAKSILRDRPATIADVAQMAQQHFHGVNV